MRISEAVGGHAAVLTLSACGQVEERVERVEAVGVEGEAVLLASDAASRPRCRCVAAGSSRATARLAASIRTATVMSGRRLASSRIFQRRAPASSLARSADHNRRGELVVHGQQIGRRVSADRSAESLDRRDRVGHDLGVHRAKHAIDFDVVVVAAGRVPDELVGAQQAAEA